MKCEILKTKTVYGTGNRNKQGPLTEIDIHSLTNGLMHHAERVYFISNECNPEEIRGGHYHLGSSEILLCVCGEAFVEVHTSDGCESVTINRDKAIFIPSECWHAVRLGVKTILLAIAEHTEKETITINKLLDNCACEHCGKLLS